MHSIRPIVFFFPISILCVAVIWSLYDDDAFFTFANVLNSAILDSFGSLFAYAVFGFLLTCIWIYFSPIGKIKIGGKDAVPLLSRWNWFAITLCTTIATGILFWSMAEPMFHLYDSGNRGIEPQSDAARQFSLVSLFMHWTLSPYAIYTIASLAFALSIYNLGRGSSLSGPLSVLFGKIPKIITDILDALILLSLVMGMAASMGTGLLMLAGGFAKITGIDSSPFIMAIVALIIVSTVLISSITGLTKGIRILSDINIKYFFVLALFIFIFGPTAAILSEGADALIGYTQEIIPRSLLLGVADDRAWANDWTIFYWANWFAWAPVTAIFLGKIARGYTVRAFILINLILPSLFSIVWMSIFGVFSMSINAANDEILKQSLEANGAESVAFVALEFLPLGSILIIGLLLLAFISYVTAADSNSEAIRMICQKPQEQDKQEDSEPIISDETEDKNILGITIKIIWIGLIGIASWIMVSNSGIDGVRMLSNLGGLPALFIIIALNVVLIKLSLRPKLLKA